MGSEQIVITEIPYNVNRAILVERIADLVNEKVLTEVSAIRDESDENTRVVIELKRDGNPKIVINNLYKHTAMESSFAVSCSPSITGGPNCFRLRKQSPATSNTGAKWSCAAPASNCAEQRSPRKRSKVISSR